MEPKVSKPAVVIDYIMMQSDLDPAEAGKIRMFGSGLLHIAQDTARNIADRIDRLAPEDF